MNEEFQNQGNTVQSDGWQNGATEGMNTPQDSGWVSSDARGMNATQENMDVQGMYTAQNTTDSMNTYAGEGTFGQGNEIVQKPVNMVTGFVGAFLGVLIGVVLWVIVYQMGYIAGIAGFVMMICAFKGFELLGGGMNIPGAVICVILVLAAVYFAHNISIAISVMQEVDGYSFGSAYRYIPAFRKMSREFDSAYIHDLVIGYLLTLVAIVPSIKAMVKGGR